MLRDGMGQAAGWAADKCLDAVITNALVIDHTGIFKVLYCIILYNIYI